MLMEPKNCLSVGLDDIDKLEAYLNRIQFVEIRLDLGLSTKNLERAKKIITHLRERGLEVIATCRRVEDRGGFTGSKDERLALLKWAIEHGATMLDLEVGSEAESLLHCKNPEIEKILSYHNFECTPADIESIAESMVSRGAWLYKIVCKVNHYYENIRLLDLNRYFSSRGQNSTCFGLGEKCHYSRAFLTACTGKMNFYGIPGKTTAPGQFSTNDRELFRLDSVNDLTECYGVIGKPVSHSLSPLIHNALFEIYSLNAVFLPFYVDDIEEFMEFTRRNGINGLAVTYPWKDKRFYKHIATFEESAKKFSSGNTLFMENEVLTLADTDYAGFAGFFEEKIHCQPGRAIVIGTGNTGLKIAAYLKGRGWMLTLISRRPKEKRKTLGFQYMIENYSCLASAECELLINATPTGALSGDDWKKILPKKSPADMIVIDINYRQNAGPFLSSEVFKKNRRFDGRDMLVEQALIQFQIWTGIAVESDCRLLLQKKVEKSE